MKILLTGGAGYIGSHTTLLLLQEGYEVVIYDSFISSSRKVINAIKLYLSKKNIIYTLSIFEGDIRDKRQLEHIFHDSTKEGRPIDAVIHFAGLKSVSESIKNPLSYWDVNVFGTVNLLDVMRSNKCFSIVFSSSATIYGSKNSMPIKENASIKPINPYGNTKAAVEKILEDLSKSKKNEWNISILRYFNPVAAHPSGTIGEDTKGDPSNLFPYITQVAIGKKPYLKVFGNDYCTTDGTGIRDYIHVMDLAEGHLAALKQMQSKSNSLEVFNLGSGQGYSVLEIIREFQKSTKCSVDYIIEPRRDGDIPISIADTNKAKKVLGWYPKKTLKEICNDGWNWQKKNPNGYQ